MNDQQPQYGQGMPRPFRQPTIQPVVQLKPKEKFTLVNIALTIVNIFLVMAVAWLLMDLTGVSEATKTEMPTQNEITPLTTGNLELSSYFTIIDRYTSYSKQDDPTFCYTAKGFYNNNEIASPVVAYSILDWANKEISKKIILSNLRNYKEEYEACEVIDSSNLKEGVYTLKIMAGDGFTGDYKEKDITFRLTQYPRHLIYSTLKDQMSDKLTIDLTYLVDVMNADQDRIREERKYAAGQPIVVESEITSFSRAQFDGKQRSWIVQEIRVTDENGLVVYSSDNQDFITDIAEDKLIVVSIIDTNKIKPGMYTVSLHYADLYSYANTDATPIEVEIV